MLHPYLWPKKLYGIPFLKIYNLNPNSVRDLFQAYYGGPYPLPQEQIQEDIIAVVQRIGFSAVSRRRRDLNLLHSQIIRLST